MEEGEEKRTRLFSLLLLVLQAFWAFHFERSNLGTQQKPERNYIEYRNLGSKPLNSHRPNMEHQPASLWQESSPQWHSEGRTQKWYKGDGTTHETGWCTTDKYNQHRLHSQPSDCDADITTVVLLFPSLSWYCGTPVSRREDEPLQRY